MILGLAALVASLFGPDVNCARAAHVKCCIVDDDARGLGVLLDGPDAFSIAYRPVTLRLRCRVSYWECPNTEAVQCIDSESTMEGNYCWPSGPEPTKATASCIHADVFEYGLLNLLDYDGDGDLDLRDYACLQNRAPFGGDCP